MFLYSDPTGSGRLVAADALQFWRQFVRAEDVTAARQLNSAYTLLDAFDEIPPESVSSTTVSWIAFPKSANAILDEIDARRQFQDEYVEWHAIRNDDDQLERVVFTTELDWWWGMLAAVSFEAVVEGLRDLYPEGEPSVEELFGSDFDPDAATPGGRFNRFSEHLAGNPWNNGAPDLFCLQHPNNTLGALFTLIKDCGIHLPDLAPSSVCGEVACAPERNSDPFICTAVQNLTAAGHIVSLKDPVGIRFLELEGIWKLDGEEIDINDPDSNHGAWEVSRNGRRGVFTVLEGLTFDEDPITHGAQIAQRLRVGTDVLHAPGELAPAWARTGMESSRIIS